MGESCGCNLGTIDNSYNIGSIKGAACDFQYLGGVAGFIGDSNAKLDNSYNVGNVTSTSSTGYRYVGGTVGSNGALGNSRGTIYNSYCTTLATYSYYYYSSGYKTSITGRVDAEELKGYVNTLGSDNWTADVNNINDGFPILKWQVK